MTIDGDKLRKDLEDHYGTATRFSPMAFIELEKVKKADGDELLEIAQKNGVDLGKYEIIDR